MLARSVSPFPSRRRSSASACAASSSSSCSSFRSPGEGGKAAAQGRPGRRRRGGGGQEEEESQQKSGGLVDVGAMAQCDSSGTWSTWWISTVCRAFSRLFIGLCRVDIHFRCVTDVIDIHATPPSQNTCANAPRWISVRCQPDPCVFDRASRIHIHCAPSL